MKIEGRIDMDSAPELEKYLKDNSEGAEAYEFDMKKVDYISSAGLRIFMALKKKHMDNESYIVIRNMSDTVRSIFDLTGFSEMFIIK